jgi:hypothetical protein
LRVTAEDLVVNYVDARSDFPRQTFGISPVAVKILACFAWQSRTGVAKNRPLGLAIGCSMNHELTRIISYVRPTPQVGRSELGMGRRSANSGSYGMLDAGRT